MVIVEILCYREQNNSGKILHDKFYDEILKETKNKEYLSERQLNELFSSPDIEIQSDSVVETQNGRYKYVWVTAKNS